MADAETLTIPCEVREDATRESPGRLFGTVLTYGEPAGDRGEVFAPGALVWPDTGVVVNVQHDRKAAIMRVVPEVRGGVVTIDAPLPNTQRGRDVATEIRAGLWQGLSVEFVASSEGVRNGRREIRRARLAAIGVVDDPSYKGSRVEVRAQDGNTVETLADRLHLL